MSEAQDEPGPATDRHANDDAKSSNREAPTIPPAKLTDESPTLPPAERRSPGTTADFFTKEPSDDDQQRILTNIEMPRAFGDYELLEEIARGGMGVVYKARQISLNRTVALKMILAGQLAGEEEVNRFHTEAEAAANLRHPNIVAVHEVDQIEGQHFFSMDYVDGKSLSVLVKENPLAAKTAARYVRTIARAIHYAHEQGILHRDLKPSNILIDQNDQPQITDFGLAKRVQGNSDLTATGQVLGTPGYLPPEQAAAATDQIGPASDVYSIGAILYELLTGRPPFRAETPLDTLMQVVDSQPVPPRLLNPNVPHDLETICLKCLEKRPDQRYRTAQELSGDLERYLNDEAIQASSINLLDRVTRALGQSRHDEHFKNWGLALIALGLTIFAAHLWMFAMEHVASGPLMRYWIPRSVMFIVLLAMLCYFRPQTLWPTNSAERLIWAVWIGYLFALGTTNVVLVVQGYEATEIYVFSSILSGFGFFVMGGHVWGGSYLIGAAFFVAAPLLAYFENVSSLVFGALWGAALLAIGGHYWLRGRIA